MRHATRAASAAMSWATAQSCVRATGRVKAYGYEARAATATSAATVIAGRSSSTAKTSASPAKASGHVLPFR